MLQTSLCRLLKIELPIIQAPIGKASNPSLAAAVSSAGGLGMLGMNRRDADSVRWITRETYQLTDRPFGINLILRPQEDTQRHLSICLEEGARVISFFWDDPSPYIERVHSAGALVMHTVGSAAEASKAVDVGVDIIVAQGAEAGGHVWGQVATMPLIPAVVDAVAPVPVVAAGGISDGRGVAAALALGAAGVWLGTRFVASEESVAHSVYKNNVLQAAETDTVLSQLFDIGWPGATHRALRNSTVRNWEEAGCPPAGQRPGESEEIGRDESGHSLIRYSGPPPHVGLTGDIEALSLYAGQSVGLVSEIKPAGDIVRELAEEAVRVLAQCAKLM
jgi:nitronate monooxygenase